MRPLHIPSVVPRLTVVAASTEDQEYQLEFVESRTLFARPRHKKNLDRAERILIEKIFPVEKMHGLHAE
jgi:hypothetical protein